MEYIKSYHSYNESWRKAKAYLGLPALATDVILSKLLNYIPKLNFLYKSMAAKIDTGTSNNMGSGSVIGEFEKIGLKDIQSEKVRRSLKLSGLLKDWNIYKITGRLSGDRKIPIYISKDELNPGDHIHGERLSLPDDFSTEFYVVAAKHTEEHEEMGRERRSSRERKQYNSYREKVRKSDYFLERTSMGDFSPLFHSLIKNDYLDLVKECLNRTESVRVLITRRFNSDGDRSHHNSRNSLELQMDDEMRKLLIDALYQDWLKNKK